MVLTAVLSSPRGLIHELKMDFIIDTVGDDELIDKDVLLEPEDEFANVDSDALSEILNEIITLNDKNTEIDKKEELSQQRSRDIKGDNLIDNFFIDMGWGPKIGEQSFKDKLKGTKDRFKFDDIDYETGKIKIAGSNVNVENEMKKSILKPGLEKEVTLPEYDVSDKRLKAIRKLNRDKTKGPSWFNMPAPEITEQIKNDLQVLKMRSAFDPKRFYKKNDMEAIPKYFQFGRVMDSALDHQNVRTTKKERKQTIVDELLADAQFKRYNKKKYKEIIEEKRKTNYKTYMKDKRMRNKQAAKERKKETALQKINTKFER